MHVVLNRPPVAPQARDASGPQLSLRLSDGYSWAHEFRASGPATLADGCFEAWVACRMEWQRRAEQIPVYQTIKRAQVAASIPGSLQLHVRDESMGLPNYWVNANYGTSSERQIIVRAPGSVSGRDWGAEPWETYWLRCLRCWNAAHALAAFCRSIPRMLDEGGALA